MEQHEYIPSIKSLCVSNGKTYTFILIAYSTLPGVMPTILPPPPCVIAIPGVIPTIEPPVLLPNGTTSTSVFLKKKENRH